MVLQWDLEYMCLFELRLSQGVCPVVGFLGYTVVLFLVFKVIFILFSIVAASVYIPNSGRGFLFSISSPAFIVCIIHFLMVAILTSGEGNGTPLQCSCLENPRGGGSWWAAVYGVPQSRTRLHWLSSSSSSSILTSVMWWYLIVWFL